MSNTLPANLQSTLANLETAQKSTPKDISSDFNYLKLAKDGNWVYGADETEVDSKSLFVVDPNSYAQGYVAWDDGELVEEVMAVAGQAPVVKTDLPDIGVQWNAQVAFAFKGIEGEEEGLQFLYKVSSKGGRDAVATLLGSIIERIRAGEEAICPLIELETSSYKHKKFGKIYTPVLTVIDWVRLDELADDSEDESEVKKVEKKPEPEAEVVEAEVVEPEAETKPARRRRRRSA